MDGNITRREAIQTLTVGGVTVALSGCEVSVDDGSPGDTPMPDRHGPVRNGRFEVHIDEIEVAGFQSVTIPSTSVEEAEYREGEDTEQEKSLWGQTTFDDLEMERGVIPGDSTIRDWRDAVLEGRVDSATKTVTVTLLDEEDELVIEWQFRNAWITGYEPPELVAGEDDVATESCTVAFDRMVREEV